MLNKLYDENVQLKEKNEQLKEERNYFERKKCEYFNKYNKKHLDNIQLKEENEQLKKEIRRLECLNNQLERRLDYDIAYDMEECE